MEDLLPKSKTDKIITDLNINLKTQIKSKKRSISDTSVPSGEAINKKLIDMISKYYSYGIKIWGWKEREGKSYRIEI